MNYASLIIRIMRHASLIIRIMKYVSLITRIMNYVSLILRIMKYALGENNNNNNMLMGPVDRGGWKITIPALQASSLKDRKKGYPERKRCGKKHPGRCGSMGSHGGPIHAMLFFPKCKYVRGQFSECLNPH